MQRLVMSSAQATAVVVQAAQEAAGGYVCSYMGEGASEGEGGGGEGVARKGRGAEDRDGRRMGFM